MSAATSDFLEGWIYKQLPVWGTTRVGIFTADLASALHVTEKSMRATLLAYEKRRLVCRIRDFDGRTRKEGWRWCLHPMWVKDEHAVMWCDSGAEAKEPTP